MQTNDILHILRLPFWRICHESTKLQHFNVDTISHQNRNYTFNNLVLSKFENMFMLKFSTTYFSFFNSFIHFFGEFVNISVFHLFTMNYISKRRSQWALSHVLFKTYKKKIKQQENTILVFAFTPTWSKCKNVYFFFTGW